MSDSATEAAGASGVAKASFPDESREAGAEGSLEDNTRRSEKQPQEAGTGGDPGRKIVYASQEFNPEDFRYQIPEPTNCVGVFGFGSNPDMPKEVYKAMKRFGQMEGIDIVKDNRSGKNKGYAFVYYKNIKDSRRAVEETNKKGLIVKNLRLRLDFSKANRGGIPKNKKLPKSLSSDDESDSGQRQRRGGRDRSRRDRSRGPGKRGRQQQDDRRRRDDDLGQGDSIPSLLTTAPRSEPYAPGLVAYPQAPAPLFSATYPSSSPSGYAIPQQYVMLPQFSAANPPPRGYGQTSAPPVQYGTSAGPIVYAPVVYTQQASYEQQRAPPPAQSQQGQAGDWSYAQPSGTLAQPQQQVSAQNSYAYGQPSATGTTSTTTPSSASVSQPQAWMQPQYVSQQQQQQTQQQQPGQMRPQSSGQEVYQQQYAYATTVQQIPGSQQQGVVGQPAYVANAQTYSTMPVTQHSTGYVYTPQQQSGASQPQQAHHDPRGPVRYTF